LSRRERTPGQWIAIAAVASATAVLFVAFGLQCAVKFELDVLLDRIGANIFYFYLEEHTRFDEEDCARVATLDEVAEVAGVAGGRRRIDPAAAYSVTYSYVSPEYFEFLRLPFARGASFAPGDRGVVVLGAELARIAFGASDPIGQTIDGHRIVGVLDEIPSDDAIRAGLNAVALAPAQDYPIPGKPYGMMWVRTSGSIDDAIQAIEGVFPSMHVFYAAEQYRWAFGLEKQVNRLLFYAAFGLFLLAATIVSGTLTLSSLSQRSEIGVRLAVGAQGQDIARLLAREALTLVLTAGLAGAVLGLIAFPIGRALGTSLRLGGIHLTIIPLILLLAVISSLLPGWASVRLSPIRAMSARELDGDTHRGIGAGLLIVAVSAAIGACVLYVFLCFGAATNRWFDALIGDVDERALLVASPEQSILTPPKLTHRDKPALERIAGLESVTRVGTRNVALAGMPKRDAHVLSGVGEGYASLGLLPISAGRDLTAEEIASNTRSALLEAGSAAEIFGIEDPIGQTVNADNTTYTVVGVFSSNAVSNLFADSIVVPYGSYGSPLSYHDHLFWVRMSPGVDVAATAAAIQAVIREQHPGRADVMVTKTDTLHPRRREMLQGIGLRLALLTAVALLLASANTFNLTRFHLALQRRELGIRRAVGASDSTIIWRGSGQGLRIALLAAVLGPASGVLVARLLDNEMSINVETVSVAYMAMTSAVILLLGVMAGGAAGWMATRGSPADALRKGRE